jgi:polyisoprenoid-binding protein YceI
MNKRSSLLWLGSLIAVGILFPRGPVCAETMHLKVDTQKSVISAVVKDPLSNLRDIPSYSEGTFDIITGEIDGDPDNLASTGKVKLVINATTYNSGNSVRDRNVIGSALETGQYPGIHFESTRMEDVQVVTPGATGNVMVVGNLTIHGTTREVRCPVSVSMSPDGIFTASGEIAFDYTDFGVKRPRLAFLIPASKEVSIKYRVIATRPEASGAPPAGGSAGQ